MSNANDSKEQSERRDADDSGLNAAAPAAVIRSSSDRLLSRMRTRLWWLTGICIVLAVGLVLSNFRKSGVTISIRFQEGHGLKPGDALRYRGIDVGRVISVQLDEGLDDVVVQVLVDAENQRLATEGSQFWIQRARLSLGSVSGVDTVLGAKYLGVIPGKGAPALEFQGVETPLSMNDADDTEIRVRFPAGEGLDVGNPVRYRGIKVGEVIGLQLSGDQQAVYADVRLVGSAQGLARLGTQFWIERPRIDLTEVRGLETLLAGNYIALQPGSADAALSREFEGLAEPPPLPRREGSLEVELDASQRLGIVRGAPVTYRGLEVGRVAYVGLAKDGATVKITAVIDADYAELVRTNSKWWAVGGIEFEAGLRGVQVSVESFSAWVRGGVAFATPETEPGKPAVTGYRFTLEAKPQPEWLQWQPRIALSGTSSASVGLAQPTAVRVVASWKTSILGFSRRRTEKCWGLALSNGQVAVPVSLVLAANQHRDVTIEVAGTSFPWSESLAASQGPVSLIRPPTALPEQLVASWPVEQASAKFTQASVLQVVNPELTVPMAIDATRIEALPDNSLKIAPGVAISSTLAGSPVIDVSSGRVMGLLCLTDQGWLIGPL